MLARRLTAVMVAGPAERRKGRAVRLRPARPAVSDYPIRMRHADLADTNPGAGYLHRPADPGFLLRLVGRRGRCWGHTRCHGRAYQEEYYPLPALSCEVLLVNHLYVNEPACAGSRPTP